MIDKGVNMNKRKTCVAWLICLLFFVSCNFGISTDNTIPPYVDPTKDITKVWFDQDIYFVNPGDVVDIKVHTDPELKDYRIPYSYSGGWEIVETLPFVDKSDFSVISFKALDPGSLKVSVKINNLKDWSIIPEHENEDLCRETRSSLICDGIRDNPIELRHSWCY